MGASSSMDLRPEEVEDLTLDTQCETLELTLRALPLCQQTTSSHPSFPLPLADEPKEIKTLYRRFRRLDRGFRGTISTDDLTMIPEVVMNPLSPRLVAMFERDAEDRINFRSFARGLSVLSDHALPEVKSAGELWRPCACLCGGEPALSLSLFLSLSLSQPVSPHLFSLRFSPLRSCLQGV